MLRKLNKKIKGQNTAEYAILIALVVAAAIGMNVYVKRGLQARVHEGMTEMARYTNVGDPKETQYEPYYLNTAYTVERNQAATLNLQRNGETVGIGNAFTSREAGGYQLFGNVVQE